MSCDVLFCSHIGDYESLLMLLPKPPNEFCPSMKPESIALFISYKRGEKGTPLTDDDGNHVSDVFGHPMEEKCERCIEKEQNSTGYEGCQFHRGQPLIWRKGNPKDCAILENAVSQNSKDGVEYQAQGDLPLTPDELSKMRQPLVSTNSLEAILDDDASLCEVVFKGGGGIGRGGNHLRKFLSVVTNDVWRDSPSR